LQGDKPPVFTRFLGSGAVTLLAVLVFTPTLWNGFVFDDFFMIGENRLIRSLGNVPKLLTSDYWAAVERPEIFSGTRLYRPLVTISFALNHAAGGLQPVGYHLVNLLLHAGVSLAVYSVGRLFLAPAGAAVAGALFAVHPLHTEAVTGIVGRAELFMALGILVALWCYRRPERTARLGALAAFAMGLLAKEQAVVLPALLVLYDLYVEGQGERHPRKGKLPGGTLVRLVPYMGILAAYFLLRTWVLGRIAAPSPSFGDNPLAHVPIGPRLLTALAVAGRYLALFLWPEHMSPDYSYNQIPLATSLVDGRVLLAIVLWGAVLGWGGWALRRRMGAGVFAVGFICVTFLPAANLLIPIGTIMGERLFYLPSVGLCWLAGLGWEAGTARLHAARLRSLAWGALGLLLLALSSQAIRYSLVWRDDLALFSYAVEVAPDSAKVRMNLGSFLTIDRPEEAIVHLRRSIEIKPSARAWDGLGRAYINTKRWEEAIAAFKESSAIEPVYPFAYNNLGLAYVALARWQEAMVAFRRAVALKPDLAQTHRNLADVYDQLGYAEAALAQRALELNPTDPLAWLQAGQTFLRLRWPAEALGALREAARLGPSLPEAQLALAQAYDTLGQPAEAAEAYEALLRLRPALPAIHRRLAELYRTALSDPAKAAAHLREAEGPLPQR
jgi:tetratricopeptide (TPR) repeat protein